MDYKNGHIYFDTSWHCTDVDNFQFCKKISDTEFSYCQLANEDIINEVENINPKDVLDYLNTKQTNITDWFSGDIDVNDYDSDEIGEVLSAYGDILNGCDDITLRNQLICECIFETYMFTDFYN